MLTVAKMSGPDFIKGLQQLELSGHQKPHLAWVGFGNLPVKKEVLTSDFLADSSPLSIPQTSASQVSPSAGPKPTVTNGRRKGVKGSFTLLDLRYAFLKQATAMAKSEMARAVGIQAKRDLSATFKKNKSLGLSIKPNAPDPRLSQLTKKFCVFSNGICDKDPSPELLETIIEDAVAILTDWIGLLFADFAEEEKAGLVREVREKLDSIPAQYVLEKSVQFEDWKEFLITMELIDRGDLQKIAEEYGFLQSEQLL